MPAHRFWMKHCAGRKENHGLQYEGRILTAQRPIILTVRPDVSRETVGQFAKRVRVSGGPPHPRPFSRGERGEEKFGGGRTVPVRGVRWSVCGERGAELRGKYIVLPLTPDPSP